MGYPKKRDTWLDTNKEAMLDQRAQVGVVFANVCEKGFEVGGDHKGGPLNGKQIEKYGDAFKNGLHQPTSTQRERTRRWKSTARNTTLVSTTCLKHTSLVARTRTEATVAHSARILTAPRSKRWWRNC